MAPMVRKRALLRAGQPCGDELGSSELYMYNALRSVCRMERHRACALSESLQMKVRGVDFMLT
jgi:hypothetical protein